MKNYKQSGEIIAVVAPADVASGDFVVVGSFFGVAQVAALTGALVPIVREGVFTLPKATGTAWTTGDALYWDSSASKFTKTAAGNKPVGVASADAASGDTTGDVSIEAVSPETVLNAIAGASSGYKIARGETALDASNPTPVDTGLTTIIAFVATLKGTAAPGVGTSVLTANISTPPTVNVYAWKPTSNSDPTLVASTGTESFYWVAVGT